MDLRQFIEVVDICVLFSFNTNSRTTILFSVCCAHTMWGAWLVCFHWWMLLDVNVLVMLLLSLYFLTTRQAFERLIVMKLSCKYWFTEDKCTWKAIRAIRVQWANCEPFHKDMSRKKDFPAQIKQNIWHSSTLFLQFFSKENEWEQQPHPDILNNAQFDHTVFSCWH